MTTRIDRAGDIPLPLWLPASGTGPGLVLIQEIFGLDDYLKSVAADLAKLGYVVAVPELFHRFAPGWSSGHDEAGVGASMQVAGQMDFAQAIGDVVAAMNHLRGLREVTGGVGVFGFCLGGSLAFTVAAHSDPDVAVSFYGSTVPDTAALIEQISCPIQFHFGGNDEYIPRSDVQKVVDVVEGRPNAEIHVQENAGHAFHNYQGYFHDPAAAETAWELTENFLGRTLPA